MEPDVKGRKAEGGVSSFVDTNKAVGLTYAPQPGSVSQAVFVGELCGRECAEVNHTGGTTITEQNSISRLLRDRERAESKIITLEKITVVMASCLTLIVPSWNRISVILERVFMVVASCRTVSGLRRKMTTLDRTTVVMASWLALSVPSWNRIAEILDSVVMVITSLPDRERAELKNKNARQSCCGYGQLPDLVCSQLEQNSSNSRRYCHGHGQLPDRERAGEKNKNVRQEYSVYGQLPDLGCSQLEQNSSHSRQCCHGHGHLPDRERAEVKN